MIAKTITSSIIVTPEFDFNFLNIIHPKNYKGFANVSEALNTNINKSEASLVIDSVLQTPQYLAQFLYKVCRLHPYRFHD